MRVSLLAVTYILVAPVLAAQQPGPVSLDMSAGAGAGFLQGDNTHFMFAFDGMVAVRPRPDGKLIVALNAGTQIDPTAVNEVCVLADPYPGSSLGCGPNFTGFVYLGALAGREWLLGKSSNSGTMMLLGGPAYVRLNEGDRWTGVAGFPVRLDLATPYAGSAALFISFHGIYAPAYRERRLETVVARLGLRLR